MLIILPQNAHCPTVLTLRQDSTGRVPCVGSAVQSRALTDFFCLIRARATFLPLAHRPLVISRERIWITGISLSLPGCQCSAEDSAVTGQRGTRHEHALMSGKVRYLQSLTADLTVFDVTQSFQMFEPNRNQTEVTSIQQDSVPGLHLQ